MATSTQVQVLYIAYFGRPADPDGLAFWANGVVGTNEELDQLADAFAQTPEYLATIQGLSTKQIIDLFYENLFSRFAEQEGQDFWVSGIESGVLNPQDIGVDIGLAALNANPPNTDSQAIGAKADAADKYTKALVANPGDNARYSGAEGIKAGREYLDPVIDAATIPSDSEVESSVNGIGGGSGGGAVLPGGGAQGNQGGIVNGVLNLSVYEDIVNNQNTRQFEIVGGARGRQIATLPFALTTGNQSIAAVASDNAATNTLDTLDSLVDVSGTDSDNLSIAASGINNLQRAAVANIENITFALNTYNGTLVSNTVGIAATGVDNFLTTGSLAAGNTAVINATGSGASAINTSGTTAAGAAFTITPDAVVTAVTGGNANETYNALGAGTRIDTINLGAGTNFANNIGFGADVITHNTAGSTIAINVPVGGTTSFTVTASQAGATATVANNVVGNVNASTSSAGVTFVGTGGAQTFIGGTGNDSFDGGAAADTYIGGTGINDFFFRTGEVPANENVTLVTGATATNRFNVVSSTDFAALAVGGVGAAPPIAGLDNINLAAGTIGSFVDKQLTGLTVTASGDGAGGAETVAISGNTGTTTYANLTLAGGAVTTITGGAGVNNITGTAGADTIQGVGADDVINGGGGNNIYKLEATAAANGNDAITGTNTDKFDVSLFETVGALVNGAGTYTMANGQVVVLGGQNAGAADSQAGAIAALNAAGTVTDAGATNMVIISDNNSTSVYSVVSTAGGNEYTGSTFTSMASSNIVFTTNQLLGGSVII